MSDTIVLLILTISICCNLWLLWAIRQILSDLARHETVLVELIRMHPDLLYSEEAEFFDESEDDEF